MTDRRRVVLVGRGTRPGRTVDEAIDAVCAALATVEVLELSIAVLDQTASGQGLAVGWSDDDATGVPTRAKVVARVLGESFESVRLVVGEDRGLVESGSST